MDKDQGTPAFVNRPTRNAPGGNVPPFRRLLANAEVKMQEGVKGKARLFTMVFMRVARFLCAVAYLCKVVRGVKVLGVFLGILDDFFEN
jgi:hypothetical protein